MGRTLSRCSSSLDTGTTWPGSMYWVQILSSKKQESPFPGHLPNGYATGWGDGGYGLMNPDTGEYMIAYARAKGDTETEAMFTDMMNFAPTRIQHA